MKEAERRQTQGNHRRILRCGARPFGARTLDGVPPRLSPEGIIPSQRLSFRPGFLGRGLNGRYPPSPVPVQGSTSHPGHNAGRHDAQAAREQAANPLAGTALAPMTRCASAPCPSRSEDGDVTYTETNVNKKVTRYRASSPGGGRRALARQVGCAREVRNSRRAPLIFLASPFCAAGKAFSQNAELQIGAVCRDKAVAT
jgi:hypothetical protein